MNQHLKEVVRGVGVAFPLKIFSVGLNFGFNFLLARLLGAEGTGVYYLALAVTTIAMVLGQIGLGNALLRFTADNAAQEDWDRVAGVTRMGIRMAMGASFLITLILVGSASWIAQYIFSKPDLIAPIRLMALGVLPMSLINLYGELFKGLKKVRDAMIVQVVGLPFVSLPLLALLTGKLGVMGAVTAFVAASILVLLFGVYLWRRVTPQLRGLAGTFDRRLLIKTSLPLFWVSIMTLVMTMTDTILIRLFDMD